MRRELYEMRKLFETAKGVKDPEEHNLEVYHQLVYNRFEDFIRTSFPVFSSFLEGELETIVDEFLRERHTKPLLIELGREFVEFFRGRDYHFKDTLPFLEELLLYEWLEIELFNAPDDASSEDFHWEGRYRLSSTSRLLRFSYPVHRCEGVSTEDILKKKGDYYLLLYRGNTKEVRNVELTEFVYSFLKDITGGMSPEEALECRDLGEDREEVKAYLERFLKELVNFGVIIKN